MSLNEVKMQNVTRNRVGHQDKFIEILCLAPACKESATLCSKCLVNTHLECRKSVLDQEAIQKQLMGLKQFSLDIVVLQERVNQQFKELIGLIEQILSPISKYQDQPNLTNLNEIAFLLKTSPMEIINQSLESTKIQIKLLLDNHNYKQENKQLQEKKQEEKEQAPSEDAQFWYSKGRALYDQKKYSEAIDCLDKAIAINPNYHPNWYSKGKALYQQMKYSDAIDCFDKAIAINPNYEVSWYCKGEALYKQMKYSDAIDCYDKAIAINPNYEMNWYSKGKALQVNEIHDAIDCYDKAIAIDPNYHLYWYCKGQALVEIGKLTDAIQCLEKAFQIQPNESYIRNKLEETKQKLRMKK